MAFVQHLYIAKRNLGLWERNPAFGLRKHRKIDSVDPASVADLDPGSGAFLTPGSGTWDPGRVKSQDRDEQPGSYFRELRNQETIVFGL
jgi:hypothetical protein